MTTEHMLPSIEAHHIEISGIAPSCIVAGVVLEWQRRVAFPGAAGSVPRCKILALHRGIRRN